MNAARCPANLLFCLCLEAKRVNGGFTHFLRQGFRGTEDWRGFRGISGCRLTHATVLDLSNVSLNGQMFSLSVCMGGDIFYCFQ